MPYNYGIKNRYTPTALINKAYGWGGGYRGDLGDVPSRLMSTPAGMSAEQFRQQFAYEWLNSSESSVGFTNPPFASGAAGRLLPSIQTPGGVPVRIQRGYIRRGEIEAGKPESKARLYFMYNPEMITRDYVSYLDQTALDPFNTVYQSGNLVAPPSILDFSFSLMFDRQEEATDQDHPGCFVDYQFFDLVVRNVVPNDPNSTGNTLPDNGVMMVNPREITVVFSQQISVQGRPLNARVSFVKFTHRMVPTRMLIDLTIRATYLGPLKPEVMYVAEEFKTADTIPLGEGLAAYQYTNLEVDTDLNARANGEEGSYSSVGESASNIANSGANARTSALQYAISHSRNAAKNSTAAGVTKYDNGSLRTSAMKGDIFDYVDCSSLVVQCYQKIGAGPGMGWGNYGTWPHSTHGIMDTVDNNTFKGKVFKWGDAVNAAESGGLGMLQTGDLLIRRGHMGFFVSGNASQYTLFDAASKTSEPQVGQRSRSMKGEKWTHVLRPEPSGWVAQVANTGGNGPR